MTESDCSCFPSTSKFDGSSQASIVDLRPGHSASRMEYQAVSRFRPLLTMLPKKMPSNRKPSRFAAERLLAFIPTGLTPQPVILTGRQVRLEPLDLEPFFAICDAVSGAVVGMAAYWDSQPVFGVTEIAAVWFAPAFQRTPGATLARSIALATNPRRRAKAGPILHSDEAARV